MDTGSAPDTISIFFQKKLRPSVSFRITLGVLFPKGNLPMKYVLALFCLISSMAAAEAPPGNLIANLPGRKTVSLDGTWRVVVDPYETGVNARFYENRKPKSKSDLLEYNFDTSDTLKVPGDWNTQRDTLFFYEGPLWYQKSFTYHQPAQTRVFLRFGAANHDARVWLNGKKLGEHSGGYTPFNYEVTGILNDGENSVVVEVNNTRREEDVPTVSTDWWNYGGLTRDVNLVEVPQVFVQDYFIQLAKSTPGEIAGWVKLNGADHPGSVSIEIPEISVKQTVPTDASGYGEFHFPARLQLWSPENPKLYRVVVSSEADRVEDEIGFRTVETRGTQILLNGKPIFLRGIAIHEEAPFRGGRAFSEADDRTLLGWAKDLGCNFVRLAHYPHNANMTRLADRMGLLVWSEIPVYWSIDWKNPATLQNAEQQLSEMIARDHNRASIVLWSLSNETPPDEPGRTEFLKTLAEDARKLDNTRLLTSALNHTEKPSPDVRKLADPVGQYLDVLGLNEYIGWYEGSPEDASRIHWEFGYQKPVIVSEFGAGALYGMHGDAQTRFTEEYQANLFQQQIAMLRKIPALAGMSPWVLMDFYSPRRFLNHIQDFHNRKGVISDRGERKQAFYVLQQFYAEKEKEKKKKRPISRNPPRICLNCRSSLIINNVA